MEQLPLAIVPLDSLRDAPHLQPELYFLPGTEGELPRRGERGPSGGRRGENDFNFLICRRQINWGTAGFPSPFPLCA